MVEGSHRPGVDLEAGLLFIGNRANKLRREGKSMKEIAERFCLSIPGLRHCMHIARAEQRRGQWGRKHD